MPRLQGGSHDRSTTKLEQFSAHPKHVSSPSSKPASASTVISVTYHTKSLSPDFADWGNLYKVAVLSDDLAECTHSCVVPFERANETRETMAHDFAMTEHHLVFIDSPLFVALTSVRAIGTYLVDMQGLLMAWVSM